MSIGFDIIRRPAGWRLELGRRLDLSSWDIEYSLGKISCTPRPIEFLTMAFGALLFFLLAFFIAASALNPTWLGGSRDTSRGSLRFEQGANISLTILQLPGESQPVRSRLQRVAPTVEEIREATSRLKDAVTKDMTAEEKAEFMAAINRRSLPNAAKPSNRIDEVISWLILAGRILAILPVALFALVGGVCLHHALLYCRDKIELSVRQNAILFERPKLLGGTHDRVFPFDQLAAVSCHAIRRSRRKESRAYVQWFVQLVPKNPSMPTMAFDIEHLDCGADLTTPTRRVRLFAFAIGEMTGLPVLVRRPSS